MAHFQNVTLEALDSSLWTGMHPFPSRLIQLCESWFHADDIEIEARLGKIEDGRFQPGVTEGMDYARLHRHTLLTLYLSHQVSSTK